MSCSGIVTTSENIDRENEDGLTEYIVNIHVMSKTYRVSTYWILKKWRNHSLLEIYMITLFSLTFDKMQRK